MTFLLTDSRGRVSETPTPPSGPTRRASPSRTGRWSAPVLGRVVGMLAARAQCPIDKLDDALLITDAVAAHAPRFSPTTACASSCAPTTARWRSSSGRCAEGGTEGLVADATLPGVGNVLERVADEVDRSRGERRRAAACPRVVRG